MSELGTILFVIFFSIVIIACVKWLAGFIGDIEAERIIKEETEKFNKDISGGDSDEKEDSFIEFISGTGDDAE